jgi:single-strand DNA-binding protein
MANLNRVLLMGRLTRDPEIQYTSKGTALVTIGLAVNRIWKNEAGERQEEVLYTDITFFGRQAEIAGQYLRKGSPLYAEGRLKLDSWEEQGQKQFRLRVIGENLQLLARRESTEAAPAPRPMPPQSMPREPVPAQRSAPRPQGIREPYEPGEDVPF